jgi:hypothetical protein
MIRAWFWIGLGSAWMLTAAALAQVPEDAQAPASHPDEPRMGDFPTPDDAASAPAAVGGEGRAPEIQPQAPPAAVGGEARPVPVVAPRSVPAAALEESWALSRRLGGHNFLEGSFVPSALLSSHLGVRAGVEYHEVPGFTQLPTLFGSGMQAVDLKTINVIEQIDFAFRLHDLLAIYGDAYGEARVGANISTLLGTGADYTYGGDLGLQVKLLRLGGFQLSVRAQFGYFAGQAAGIRGLFQDLTNIAQGALKQIEANPVLDLNTALTQLNNAFIYATSDLLTPFNGIAYGASVNMAQGLGSYVGLQLSLGYSGERTTRHPTMYDATGLGPVTTEYVETSSRPTLSAALDLDLASAGLPIATMLEYRATPVTTSDSGQSTNFSVNSLEQLIAIGLYYSGRTDLQLGVIGYTLLGQSPALAAGTMASGNPRDLAAQLVFRYFW